MSLYEGSPNIAIEALANNCQLFLSNTDSHRELIPAKIGNYVNEKDLNYKNTAKLSKLDLQKFLNKYSIEKTYKSNGAFGYICVQSPNNEQTVSNWQQDPDLECAWTFISPNLIQRNAEGRVIQAHETNNLKHYVLSRDTSENPVFVGNVGCNEELEQVALPGSQQWSNFSA